MSALGTRQATSRLSAAWWRTVIGLVILGGLLWRLGTGPFLAGIRLVDGWTILAGVLFGFATTSACAWRWWLIARALDVPVQLGTAVAACYRAQFLNSTLPAGVLGDIHRAVSHGRAVGDVRRGVRAVVWDRSAGQMVQVLITAIALIVLPTAIHVSALQVVVVTGALVLTLLLLIGLARRAGSPRLNRLMTTISTDLRSGLLDTAILPGMVLASAFAVTSMTAMFIVAARIAGTTAAVLTLLPLGLLALLAMAVPTNIGGWGPREGATVALFASAGLGAQAGIATAVIYGVMVLVGSLPGAVVLAVSWRANGRIARVPATEPEAVPEELVYAGGGDHG